WRLRDGRIAEYFEIYDTAKAFAAATAGIPLIDLRVICNDANDYSPLSPIEPSVAGGAKIAGSICRMLAVHDFAARRCGLII
ncbi:MAG TPA: hypothetical protein VM529_18230, partial [Gemmata sp.]|nr:hypothetical protein [Gemmata sp.]